MAWVRPFCISTTLALLVGCPPTGEPNLCDALRDRCGGENWYRWCQSECVPDHARTIPCEQNTACALCDAPSADHANTLLFGLPSELEYLWTLTDEPREPFHPASEPAPTGSGFVDEPSSFVGTNPVGAWQPYEPFPGVALDAPGSFCEPGPNRYIVDNVVATNGAMVLNAERMPSSNPSYCPSGRCRIGPYTTCDAPPTGCQYREPPDTNGLGNSSQADRTEDGAIATYGYGRYRSVFRPTGDATPATSGFVYAFFTQGNLPCVDGAANPETNTSEVDVELSSGAGEAGGQAFCVPGEICLQVSTWVSSDQGIAEGGVLRHQVSGFRFRSVAAASQNRTYGWDWAQSDVRFTYDSNPTDCDEARGECAPEASSLAICRHLRFIPRRPAPLHFQLWNAWWTGATPRGTRATMTVERVWHTPYR